MNKNDQRVESCIQKLYDFRANIPANLTVNKVKDVWGIEIEKDRYPSRIKPRKEIIGDKLEVAKKSLDWLVLKPWVKFVGVSGSAGSEFAQKKDDIDLFIVVKNDRAWLYRLCIYFRNLSKKRIRSKEKVNKGEGVKDKLCLNFITEERNLRFIDDIFNLNELLYLKPIYTHEYLRVIYINNNWLKEKYLVTDEFLKKEKVTVGDLKDLAKRNYLLLLPNMFAFFGQIIYMFVMRHNPDFKRLWEGFKNGRIEFYPEHFREEKLKSIKSD
jgi:hypothetical protein